MNYEKNDILIRFNIEYSTVPPTTESVCIIEYISDSYGYWFEYNIIYPIKSTGVYSHSNFLKKFNKINDIERLLYL